MGSAIDRRRLLLSAGATGVALGTAGLPSAAEATTANDGESWRHLFVLDRDPLFMNVGTVGPSPREVLRAETEELYRIARDAVSDYHGVFEPMRTQIGQGLGCDPDELFLSGNTTDGIGTVLAGLALGPGDEVLTTNHEHPAVYTPLAILRNRRGITVRRVPMPTGNAQRAEDYVALFEAAITPATKVLLFSAPIFRTGTMLPIRMLAELAQRHGLVSIVDAAHVPGMFAYRYRELGVDFLAASGAKWQCGPARTGLLYLRNKVLPQFNPRPLPEFWPTITSTQAYPDGGLPPRSTTSVASYDIAALLQDVGNPSIAQFAGLAKACEMWDRIGRQRIEDYVLGLSQHLKQSIAERWGVSALYSPMDDPRLRSALTSFNPFVNPADALNKPKADEFVARMLSEHHITIRNTIVPVVGAAGPHYAMRVSTHVFHRRRDVDRFVDAAWRLSRVMA